MKTELLVEELQPKEASIIVEADTGNKNVWLNGIFMQCEQQNRNGRIYSLKEMEGSVKSANEIIKKTRGLLGELDHPQTLTTNLDRVSHVIRELNIRGNDVYGKALLIDTPCGNIAKEISKHVNFGVSSRGTGQVAESGQVSGYNFVTIDIVAQPSAHDAYPRTVMESIEMYQGEKEIVSLAEAIKHDKAAQKYFQKEILKFLSEGLFKKKK
jgi:hypothetical protein